MITGFYYIAFHIVCEYIAIWHHRAGTDYIHCACEQLHYFRMCIYIKHFADSSAQYFFFGRKFSKTSYFVLSCITNRYNITAL